MATAQKQHPIFEAIQTANYEKLDNRRRIGNCPTIGYDIYCVPGTGETAIGWTIKTAKVSEVKEWIESDDVPFLIETVEQSDEHSELSEVFVKGTW